MSAFFFPILETLLKRVFWYRQQLLFRFFFYLLNRSKMLSFQMKLILILAARIYWKADAHKTSHCLVRTLVQRHNWVIFWKMSRERPLQSMAIVIEPCWTNFCSQKLKRRILATFGFNRTVLRATQPKLYTMFCAMFLKIAISTAELILFGHLGAAIWHRWTIICGAQPRDNWRLKG